MCIWNVAPSDRKCDYCSYFGACEKWPSPFKIEPKPAPKKISVPSGPWSDYISAMSNIVGADILQKCRKSDIVWARNFVALQMRRDGCKLAEISSVLGLDHSTVVYCIERAKTAISMEKSYRGAISIWRKFQDEIHIKKHLK